MKSRFLYRNQALSRTLNQILISLENIVVNDVAAGKKISNAPII